MQSETVTKTEHTYLLKPGSWKITGVYHDSANNTSDLTGEAIVEQGNEQWVLSRVMELGDPAATRLKRVFRVVPMQNDSDHTTWWSDTPEVGTLMGRLMIVGNALMSSYQSESRLFSGTEVFEKVNDSTYKAKGFALDGEDKMASWEITLTKMK